MGLIVGLLVVILVCYLVLWLTGLVFATMPAPVRGVLTALVAILLLWWIFGGYSPFYAHPLWHWR